MSQKSSNKKKAKNTPHRLVTCHKLWNSLMLSLLPLGQHIIGFLITFIINITVISKKNRTCFQTENQSNCCLRPSVIQRCLSNFSKAAWAWDRDVTAQDYSENAVSGASDSLESRLPSSTLWRHDSWAGPGTTRRTTGSCYEVSRIKKKIWALIPNVGCNDRRRRLVASCLHLWNQMVFGWASYKSLGTGRMPTVTYFGLNLSQSLCLFW